MCGENLVALSTWTRAAGSSPRVRGKLNTLVCVRPPYGLIPACAGKTNEVETSVSVFGAHPRVCGENTRKAARHTLCPGSSPRVRGKPVGAEEVRSERRLIPACAGKTDRAEKSLALARAHPRVCGENEAHYCALMHPPGSSPRVRGKLQNPQDNLPLPGLIPACAGKTLNDLEF